MLPPLFCQATESSKDTSVFFPHITPPEYQLELVAQFGVSHIRIP